jgi:hypothetical protein
MNGLPTQVEFLQGTVDLVTDHIRKHSWYNICLLPDEMLTEIFLRLPPNARGILCASTVCKYWHKLITSYLFMRCFSTLHLPPLICGLISSRCNPRLVIRITSALNPNQVAKLKKVGFGDYLDMKICHTFRELGAWMLWHHDAEEMCFKFGYEDVL